MKAVADGVVLAFVVSSVFSVGLRLTVEQIVAPLRRVKLVALVLFVNFLIVPALAVAIAKGLSLSEPQSIGLILVGTAAGAPFLPKLAEVAGGNVALAVALMVLLMIVSLAYLPLALPQALTGVRVDSLKIARSLLLTMILPLSIGLLIKARRESLAERLQPLTNHLSNVSLIVVLLLIPVINFATLAELIGVRTVLASVLLIGGSFGAGYALGDTPLETRRACGFAAAARNIPAALLIGGQNFDHPHVTMMLVLFAFLSLLLLAPLARSFATKKVATT